MNDIQTYAVGGAVSCGAVGFVLGGPTFAIAGAVTGGGLGTLVRGSQYGHEQIEKGKRVAREILDKALDFANGSGKFLLRGGLSLATCLTGSAIITPLCINSSELICYLPKLTGNALMLIGGIVVGYTLFRATFQWVSSKPEPTVPIPHDDESPNSFIVDKIKKYKPRNKEECKKAISASGCITFWGGVAITAVYPAVGVTIAAVGLGQGIARGAIEFIEWIKG